MPKNNKLTCHLCGWKFYKRRGLKNHLITHHNLSSKRAKEIVDEGKLSKKPESQTLGEVAEVKDNRWKNKK